jgi:hypothetical protein
MRLTALSRFVFRRTAMPVPHGGAFNGAMAPKCHMQIGWLPVLLRAGELVRDRGDCVLEIRAWKVSRGGTPVIEWMSVT